MASKRRGLTDEQWAEVRKSFEAGESIAALSKRFGVKRDTIAAHRDQETWVIGQGIGQVPGREEARVIRDRAQAKVIDIATGRAIASLEESGQLAEIAASVASDLKHHPSISAQLMEAADELLKDFLADKDTELASTREGSGRDVIVRQGRAEVFQQLVTGIKAAVAVSREVNGLKTGEVSAPPAGDLKNAPRKHVFEVAPKPESVAS